MNDIIKKIIEESVYAPSGDNSQPWRFKVKENGIYVYVRPNIDLKFFNHEQKASLLACGCVVENIIISSSNYGLKASSEIFPNTNDLDLVAIINLQKDPILKKDLLFDFIEKRATNRKFYKNTPLSKEQKEILIKESSLINQKARIVFVDERDDIKKLSTAFTITERVILETNEIHQEFFKHVVWNKKEERAKKTGLFIKTLEMKPPEEMVFKLCRSWKIMNFLNKFGMSKFIARENAKRFNASGALGAIITPQNTKTDFVLTGRIFQRLWLKATQLNLAIHPITGVIFLMQGILTNNADAYQKYIPEITKSYDIIKTIFGVKNETIPMIFRIGYSDPPRERSSKLPPDISFE